MKRGFDLFFSVIFLFFFLPVMILVAISVRFSSPGPIIFRQKRIGKNGKFFTIFKFRSMYVHAEEGDRMEVFSGDPRITIAGKWLRKTHLDELPQLFNILQGEMSLVGPRPRPLPHFEELSLVLPNYNERHKVVPGLTGLAQLNERHRNNRLIEHRVGLKYDLFYIQHASCWLDFKSLRAIANNLFGRKGL